MKKIVNVARGRFAEARRKMQQAFDLADCQRRVTKLEKQLAANSSCKCKTKLRFARSGLLQMQNIPEDALGNSGLSALAEARKDNSIAYGILVHAENEDTLEALVLLDKAGRVNGKYPAEVWVAADSEDETFEKVWHGQGSSGVGAAKALVDNALKSLADEARDK